MQGTECSELQRTDDTDDVVHRVRSTEYDADDVETNGVERIQNTDDVETTPLNPTLACNRFKEGP